MPKSLVIVESPAKAKTINKFLGDGYEVAASMGHVRDLPTRELGVDVENHFNPTYVTTGDQEKTVKKLTKLASKSDSIYLAPDPDREGEAISWHLVELLKEVAKDKEFYRITFNEITKNAIQKAINTPLEINMDLVNAQQARRILDRLVGYKISPMLTRMVARNKSSLSAGRVQSVALRLICEREGEIRKFVPVEYWTLHGDFTNKNRKKLSAELYSVDGLRINHQGESDEKEESNTLHIQTEAQAKELIERIQKASYAIDKITSRKRTRKPPAPYITSTLQQDASRMLGFHGDRTMRIAQSLYEGIDIGDETIGLITYMRTDSVRIAEEAIGRVRDHIKTTYGEKYVPKSWNVYKTRKSAQDAHECIRPTMLDGKHSPDKLKSKLNNDQYKLYKLIWQRFEACQMAPAEYESTTIHIAGGDLVFRATGSVLIFDGFTRAYHDPEDQKDQLLPQMNEGEELNLKSIEPNQHFTKPPARYNDASLIRELEGKGIGRPSTYASIVKTLVDRNYITRQEKRFHPTDLGEVINKLLVDNFQDIFEVGFTADIEARLDEVEEGRIDWVQILKEFYDPFALDLEKAPKGIGESLRSLQEPTDIECKKCGGKMLKKWGRTSWFLACSNYPECDYTAPISEPEMIETDVECDKCGAPMVIRPGQYGHFLACSAYPDCKNTKPIPTGIKCPLPGCGGDVIQRRSRRGVVFYGCGNYPKCDFVAWDPPIDEPCPECGAPFLVFKDYKRKGPTIKCQKKECNYSRPADRPSPLQKTPDEMLRSLMKNPPPLEKKEEEKKAV
ncbi:MAG: type I DNA topoisomerase [bacterium]|nr:type I DNA topoisomerase [bacterium]